jgi:hypothetical protein
MLAVVGGLALVTPSAAYADRVVLMSVGGEAPEELRDDVADALQVAIGAAGHASATETGAATDAPPPTTAAEMRAVADVHQAMYVVYAAVAPLRGGYALHLRVGYAPETRLEELHVEVAADGQASRLADVLTAMLRPAGVGDDAVRLTEVTIADLPTAAPDPVADPGPSDAEREAREEFLRREEEREAQERLAEEQRWENRERYGQRKPMMLSVGVDLRPILSHPSGRTGGVLGGLSARLGHALSFLPGLEIRGVFDLVTGATSGFALGGGAVFLASLFDETPVFIGGGLELGLFQALSGNRVPAFMIRGGVVAAFRPFENVYFEASLPELQVLTSNEGVITLGVSVRGGFRF